MDPILAKEGKYNNNKKSTSTFKTKTWQKPEMRIKKNLLLILINNFI